MSTLLTCFIPDSDLLTEDIVGVGDLIHQQRSTPRSGEIELLKAILFAAADDLRGDPRSLNYWDAKAWVEAASTEPHGFSWLCSILGLNPQATAAAMLRGQTLDRKRRICHTTITARRGVREIKEARARRGSGD